MRIVNSSNDCAIEEKTNDSLGKLIFVISPPLVTILLVQETNPEANNCQIDRPTNANTGYGISVLPIFSMPERFKKIKEATIIRGIIITHKNPNSDCL